MISHIIVAIKLSFFCILVFAVAYPSLIWAIAQVAPYKGRGETVVNKERIVGFARVGQSFTADKYFNSRPSAVSYNAAGSGGSNKGPINPDYLKDVQSRIDTFMIHNLTIKKSDIPTELVTASGSGLDPDLSPQGALVQVPRIAIQRGISEEKLRTLVSQFTYHPVLGTTTINVLALNVALDALK